jgi:hypothetical protein
MKPTATLVEIAEYFAEHLPAIKQLEHLTKTEHELQANIERLKADQAKMIQSYKLQGIAAAKDEAKQILAQAHAEAQRQEAIAQHLLDAVNAEVRQRQQLLDQTNADLERAERSKAEYASWRERMAAQLN